MTTFANRNRTAAGESVARMLRVAALTPMLLAPSFSFRRSRPKVSRDDAFAELFGLLASVYEAAAAMKPEWRTDWEARSRTDLPIRYSFGNEIAADGGASTRFAVRLLQRNRWKSRVDPIFAEWDAHALQRFEIVASSVSRNLIETSERHRNLLHDDEMDWVTAAVEQFDEATRQRRKNAALGHMSPQDVAAAIYQPIYIAVQLADRLAERLFREWEAQQ